MGQNISAILAKARPGVSNSLSNNFQLYSILQLLQFAESRIKDVSVDEDRTRAEKNIAWLWKNEKILKDYFQKSVPKRRWNLF